MAGVLSKTQRAIKRDGINNIMNGNSMRVYPIFHLVDCLPRGGDAHEKGNMLYANCTEL